MINNAAVQYPQDNFSNIDLDQVKITYDTNVISYFHIVLCALKYLKENDCIINTSSVTAYRVSDYLVDYASTKGAIFSLTRFLSKMLANKNNPCHVNYCWSFLST